MSPHTLFTMQLGFWRFALEAQSVIALRTLGIIGVLPAHHGENERMVAEKLPALIKANAAAGRAAMSGKRPDQILSAWQSPLSRRMRANRRRLLR